VKAAVAPMRTIVIETTQRLQVGLRQAPTDLSNSSDSAVVDQFRVTEAAAQKEFPVGPQARANVGDAREASESSNVTTMERGSKAATRIGKK